MQGRKFLIDKPHKSIGLESALDNLECSENLECCQSACPQGLKWASSGSHRASSGMYKQEFGIVFWRTQKRKLMLLLLCSWGEAPFAF